MYRIHPCCISLFSFQVKPFYTDVFYLHSPVSYTHLEDIQWFRDYKFPKESSLLGPVKMSVTQINAGTQHNVIPDTCTFVVEDVYKRQR